MINYHRISQAIAFYESLGYVYVETPWIVSRRSTRVTTDSSAEYVQRFYKDASKAFDLVGSAEQGFIALMQEGKLQPGRYVSAGPCFRFADNGRPGKHPYFFKVELIEVDPQYPHLSTNRYHHLLFNAEDFFRSLANTNFNLEYVDTPEGTDIFVNGLEVGSYGYRQHPDVPYPWSYGTGLAEPRFTEALNGKV